MNRNQIQKIKDKYEKKIFSKENREKILLTIEWKNQFTTKPGVYIIFEKRKIIYVGESGSLCGRMNDLRRTVNHTFRRTIGAVRFSNIVGFQKATSKKKFPAHVEQLVTKYICGLKIAVLPIEFGRKEIEEYLILKYQPLCNIKRRRG